MSISTENNLDKNLFDLIQTCVIKVLLDDPRTMPMNILRIKTYKEVKKHKPDMFIKDDDFMTVITKMQSEYLIGLNRFNKFFVDYLNYQPGTVFGTGYIEIDKLRGNGFITVKKDVNEFKKSTHFVHKKNLNGAKNGDYVKYVELVVNNPKHFNKFALVDAAVVETLEAPVDTE